MNYTTAQLRKALFNSHKGFTLIELLVVIAIIAVLAVMGFAAFSGLTGRGNDDRRRADLKAIADALEVRKGTNTSYQTIFGTDFAAGVPPQEPSRTAANTPKYCYTDGTASIANPTTWANNANCPSSAGGSGTGWMVINNATVPTVSAGATFFKVCGLDETNVIGGLICFGSRQ